MNSYNKKIRKVCCVITARPSYSRIKSALHAINNSTSLELQIILTCSSLSSKYGNVSDTIIKDGFTVNEKIFSILQGDGPEIMAKTTGMSLLELASMFQKHKPDLVITIADRYETLATSIAASYQNIPLVHIQGGEVTGNIDEKVRHANTKLADLHLVSSDDALKRVIKMGEKKDTVFNTGCPSIDLAKKTLKSNNFFDPVKKYGGVGRISNWRKGYLVVIQHPVTTEFIESKKQITEILNAISELNIPTFWFWPNVDAGSEGTSNGIRQFREFNNPENILFIKHMDAEDHLLLIKNSMCLVGNSSLGIRECSYLGTPVVNIGSRQYRRLKGSNSVNSSYEKNEIINLIKKQINHGPYESEQIYGDGSAGQKIANILSTFELNFHKTIDY
jgi:bifunctional UDP-N-acetylglucosamine 2-epimerase / N-acetylmannosamine kinase